MRAEAVVVVVILQSHSVRRCKCVIGRALGERDDGVNETTTMKVFQATLDKEG